MAIEKIIDIPEYFNDSLEPSVSTLDFNSNLFKEANVKEIEEIKNRIPKKYLDSNKYFILKIIALGAGEYYGSNTNGDYFPEKELKKDHKTFETNAKVYLFHKNKNPKKSYGDIIEATYNEKMHRVELIVAIEKDKLPKEIKDKIDLGENIPFSMGVKVLKDICSICGNIRSVYNKNNVQCTHRKLDLGKVFPDGRKCYLINEGLNFYDISIVKVPADKIAYPLLKVAEEMDGDLVNKYSNITWDLLIDYVGAILGIPKEEVETNREQIKENIDSAMMYLNEHPEDYFKALELLNIKDELDKKAEKYYPIHQPVVIKEKESGINLMSLLVGAFGMWLLNRMNRQTPEEVVNSLQPKLNYGNGIILERDPEGHYFVLSNTKLK